VCVCLCHRFIEHFHLKYVKKGIHTYLISVNYFKFAYRIIHLVFLYMLYMILVQLYRGSQAEILNKLKMIPHHTALKHSMEFTILRSPVNT